MDTLLAGGHSSAGNSLFYVDNKTSFAQSAELNGRLTYITRQASPLENGGDCVFKRLYVTVAHRGYLPAIKVTPIVDGVVVTEMERAITAGIVGTDNGVSNDDMPYAPEHLFLTRVTFAIPLMRYLRAADSSIVGTVGLRGSTIQLQFQATEPQAHFYLESAEIHFVPATASKDDRTLPAGPRN